MYKILEVSDKIRVPPEKFDLELKEAVKSSLEDKWEGIIDPDLGVVLAVISVEDIGEGKIIAEDPAIHYPTTFKILVYHPEQHEVVIGNVIDVTQFGVFLRIGPVDGMIHVSQLMDDFVSYDQKNAIFTGKETKRKLKEGDIIRARIISISIEGNQYKIGLTSRQPGLGALHWLEKEKKKPKEEKKEGEKSGK